MLFSSCSSARTALLTVPRIEVYGISGPFACGSDPLFPTGKVPEKVQEQDLPVNSTVLTLSESPSPFEQQI
jgi:hypothetical protein